MIDHLKSLALGLTVLGTFGVLMLGVGYLATLFPLTVGVGAISLGFCTIAYVIGLTMRDKL